MSNSTTTMKGNAVADAELRTTTSGLSVSSFRMASTYKKGDVEETMFVDVVTWRDQGENVAESVKKGDRVMVLGRLKQREWENKDGEKRSTLELEADEVAMSLRFATARAVRTQRNANAGNNTGGGNPAQAAYAPPAQAAYAPPAQAAYAPPAAPQAAPQPAPGAPGSVAPGSVPQWVPPAGTVDPF